MLKALFKIFILGPIILVLLIVLLVEFPDIMFSIRNHFTPNFEKILFEENDDVFDLKLKIGRYTDDQGNRFTWNNYEIVDGFYGVLDAYTSRAAEGFFQSSGDLEKWSWKIKGYQQEEVLLLRQRLEKKYSVSNVSDYWNKQNNDNYKYYVIRYKGREVFWVDTGTTLTLYYDPYVSYIDWSIR